MPPNNDELMPDIPPPTCPKIDEIIRLLEDLRTDNVHLRYGHDCAKTLYSEAVKSKDYFQARCLEIETRTPIPAPTPSAEAVRVAVEALERAAESLEAFGAQSARLPEQKEILAEDVRIIDDALSALRAIPVRCVGDEKAQEALVVFNDAIQAIRWLLNHASESPKKQIGGLMDCYTIADNHTTKTSEQLENLWSVAETIRAALQQRVREG